MAAGLVVVNPIQMTDATFVSSTVPEDDYAVWSSVTTYALGSRCILTSGVHKIYESLQSVNLNHAVGDAGFWVEVSPTNRWKCFDTSNTSQTAKASSAQYVLYPGQAVTHVALANNTGVISFRVRMHSASHGDVYDRSSFLSLILNNSNWYDFFFNGRHSISESYLDDIPNYADATFTIDISGGTEMAFGTLILGVGQSVGLGVQYGARVSIQDYSRKEVNAFGDTVLVKRAYAKRASFQMQLDNEALDSVNRLFTSLRATPCLWVGHSDYVATIVFGTYENFEITIQYATVSDCSLNLLGLT